MGPGVWDVLTSAPVRRSLVQRAAAYLDAQTLSPSQRSMHAMGAMTVDDVAGRYHVASSPAQAQQSMLFSVLTEGGALDTADTGKHAIRLLNRDHFRGL
jgi:hypothetical protein